MRAFLPLIFFSASILNLSAVEWESSLSGLSGTRFYDTFDSKWENIRSESETGSDATVRSSGYMRNYYGVDLSVLMSPFFRHYMGLGGRFSYFPSAEQKYQISGSDQLWTASMYIWQPRILYRYHLNDRYFAETGLGVLLGSLMLEKEQGTNKKSYNFSRIRGPAWDLGLGAILWKKSSFNFYVRGALEIGRLDNIESGGTQLYRVGENLVPLSSGTSTAGAENASIWMNSFQLSAGLMFRQ